MQLELLNEQGQATSKFDAPDTLFARDYNEALVHQIVVAFQANARQGTRAQKDRATVKHSTKKPWRQKGTGRARAGMTSSPLWRGGGRIFPNTPDENFSQKVNKKMYRAGMAAILSQLAREGRLAVVESLTVDSPKTKAEVRGGGIKPWRQKGTGQARAGSIRSPIWVGGGRAFAAKPRDFAQKVNRKMYRGAMQAMLSELARTERLSVVNGIELEAPKTKLLVQKLGELKLGSNVLILIEAHDEKLELAARNLPYVDVLPVSSLDPLSLARHDHVLATAGAVRLIEERLA